jgi:hypothetical protein
MKSRVPQLGPVGAASFRQAGWLCGSVAVGFSPDATSRAPLPW